jgi:hypothetical protein
LAEFERDLIGEPDSRWAGRRPGPRPPRRLALGAERAQAPGGSGDVLLGAVHRGGDRPGLGRQSCLHLSAPHRPPSLTNSSERGRMLERKPYAPDLLHAIEEPKQVGPHEALHRSHSTEVVLVTRGVSRGLVRLELLPRCCPPQPSWSMCRSCCRVRVRVPTVRNRRLQRGRRLQGRPAAAGQTGTAAPLEATGAHSVSGRHRPG